MQPIMSRISSYGRSTQPAYVLVIFLVPVDVLGGGELRWRELSSSERGIMLSPDSGRTGAESVANMCCAGSILIMASWIVLRFLGSRVK